MRASIFRFSYEIGIALTIIVGIVLSIGYTVPLKYFELGKAEYKSLSGILLCVFIFDQWRISRLRFGKKNAKDIRAEVHFHKLFGLAGPILFFMHAQRLGHGYFALLTICYFAVFIGGVFHDKIVAMKKPLLVRLSLIAHITFATILLGVIFFHIYSVAYFGLVAKSQL